MKFFWKWYYKNVEAQSKREANLMFARTMPKGFVIKRKV